MKNIASFAVPVPRARVHIARTAGISMAMGITNVFIVVPVLPVPVQRARTAGMKNNFSFCNYNLKR
jgi:hypothetical protein